MFQTIHRRLTLICCLITAVIAAGIMILCLSVSEKHMQEQEYALFLLQADTISTDLRTRSSFDIEWYQRLTANAYHPLYIEFAEQPLTLVSLLLSEHDQLLIDEVLNSDSCTSAAATITTGRTYQTAEFSYTAADGARYFARYASVPLENSMLHYLWLYQLDSYYEQVQRQRITFAIIWGLSVTGLFAFAWIFTGQVLKPLIDNQQKQKQFVAHASHELRAPLAVVKTGLSILETDPPTEKAAHFRELMAHETDRMERLIRDLLFLSRADESAWPYQFKRTDMNQLLRNCYTKFLPEAKKQQLTLLLLVPPTPVCYCYCDPERMEQVLTILLDNACAYTPGLGTVEIRLTRTRSRAILEISDNGPGLSAKEKTKVFNRFYQADAAHNNKNHSGLGLSIAREICQAHSFELRIDDTPGGGCTFVITAPLI